MRRPGARGPVDTPRPWPCAPTRRAASVGHLKRCLALAQALQESDLDTVFLGRRSDADGAALVTAAGFHWLTLPGPAVGDAGLAHDSWLPVTPEQDAADTVAVLACRPLHAVVVDHYALDARWHDAVRRATGVALVAIDDLADRPLAVDLLVDPNPAADHAAKWHAVLRRPARLCTGPAHALLDRAYRRQPARPWHDRVACIGIFMGGTDPGAHSELAGLACRAHAGWTGPIAIATTSSANARLPALQVLCDRDPGLRLVVDQPDLAAFHASHDLQIGAGGGALWERCALGVPTLALVTAPNQRLSVPLLADAGVVCGFDAVEAGPETAAQLGAVIARLLAHPGERLRCAARRWRRRRPRRHPRGRGASPPPCPSIPPGAFAMSHRLRLLRDTDLETVMLWRMKPKSRATCTPTRSSTLDGQRQWLQRLQQSDRDQVWIIELLDGARPVGLLSLTEIDRVNGRCSLPTTWANPTCVAPGWHGRWSSMSTPGCSRCWG